MDYIEGLNPEQKAAVLSESKHIRVIAGAGSGKTRVLTSRLVHLVESRNYNPKRLCAITFTNKAANEMKDRLEDMLGGFSPIHVSTIHSLCVMIIRMEHEALGLPRSFTVIDSNDQNQIMKEAYAKFDIQKQDVSTRDAINYISNNKMAHVSVSEAYKLAGNNYFEKAKAKVYDYYQNRLKELDSLDFDDLLLQVYYLLKKNKECRRRWQNRFDVICVDEFQDVDEVQYGIVQSLVGEDNEIYVVGDPDQTIYTWRGANVHFISNFDKMYPDAETITLNKNYRSTQEILEHANNLIQNNQNRPHKDLVANDTRNTPVVYKEFTDDKSEADWIARQIIDLKARGESYLDMAVLYRSNYLSRVLEQVFSRHQIPYIIYGGQSFYDRMEIRDMIAYLRMISHGDDLALRRSVAKPRRGIGEKTIADYALRAQEKSSSIYQMMHFDYLNGKSSKNISAYVELIENLKEDALNLPLDRLIETVFQKTGLRKFYQDRSELDRQDSVRELANDAKSFIDDHLDADLIDYLQMISLYTDKAESKENEVVRLMTVHAAKGLEFENVFIPGLADGIFPNRISIVEGRHGVEEERRLMYVAVTRAKHRLFLSNNSAYSYVLKSGTRPSRFIKEMNIAQDEGMIDIEFARPQKIEKQIRKNKREMGPQDVVVHDVFGEGIIINMDDKTMLVAFTFPHGTKTISLSYAGLKRKEP